MSDLISQDELAGLPDRYQRRAHQIAARVAEINAVIEPCDPVAIRDTVIRLRSQFRPQPDTETPDMLADFKFACKDLPAWALSEAANDFLAGLVENHTGQFMPTCAEFAKRAREILKPFLAERHSLRIEASKLVQRAIDEQDRIAAEIERQDPQVKLRVASMIDDFMAGQPKHLPMRSEGLTPEKQAALDALKKPRKIGSKLGYRGPQGDGDRGAE